MSKLYTYFPYNCFVCKHRYGQYIFSGLDLTTISRQKGLRDYINGE